MTPQNAKQCLVRLAIDCLPPNERAVIIHRYGIKGDDSMAQKATAKVKKMSTKRIKQVEAQAKERLKKNPLIKLAAEDITVITTDAPLEAVGKNPSGDGFFPVNAMQMLPLTAMRG